MSLFENYEYEGIPYDFILRFNHKLKHFKLTDKLHSDVYDSDSILTVFTSYRIKLIEFDLKKLKINSHSCKNIFSRACRFQSTWEFNDGIIVRLRNMTKKDNMHHLTFEYHLGKEKYQIKVTCRQLEVSIIY